MTSDPWQSRQRRVEKELEKNNLPQTIRSNTPRYEVIVESPQPKQKTKKAPRQIAWKAVALLIIIFSISFLFVTQTPSSQNTQSITGAAITNVDTTVKTPTSNLTTAPIPEEQYTSSGIGSQNPYRTLGSITNPSFEDAITTEWVYSETDTEFTGGRVAPTNYVPTQGSYVYLLGQDTSTGAGGSPVLNIVPGVYSQVLQTIDLTDVTDIKFDTKYIDYYGISSYFNISAFIDSTLVWSRLSIDYQAENITLDTSTYSGSHDLKFRLTGLFTGAIYEPAWFIDNIRLNQTVTYLITNYNLTPSIAYFDTPLIAQATYSSNATGNVSFRWSINGQNKFNLTNLSVNPNSYITNTLQPGNFTTGDSISLSITGQNATDSSTTSPLTLTISSYTPNLTSVLLNTTHNTYSDNDNLTLYLNSSSQQGFTLHNIINWYKNNVPLLVVNMPFERVNGTNTNNAYDYSIYAHNGSENGGVVWNRTIGYGTTGAYIFDGANDYLQIEQVPQITKNFSVEYWVMRNGTRHEAFAFTNDGSQNKDDPFSWDGNQINIGDGLNHEIKTVTLAADTNVWTHIIFTVDGSNKILRQYKNGTLVDDLSLTYTPSSFPNKFLRIGRGGFAEIYTEYFQGAIDNFRVYNRTLTPDQVKLLYQNQTDVIVQNETYLGETWKACVTIHDTFESSNSTCSNSITFGDNHIPTQFQPIIQSLDATTSTSTDLACYNQSTTDFENDPVKNIYNWKVNDKSIAVLNMPFENYSLTYSGETKDYSGYNNNGTNTSGAFWNATGGFDGKGAYRLDGVDDYISIKNNASLNFVTNYSISFWTKNEVSPANFDTILAKTSGTGWSDGYGIYYSSSSQINFWVSAYGSAYAYATITPTLWNHVVGTYDGSTIRIFVNGVEGTPGTRTTPATNTAALEIGRGASNSYNIDGHIDELLIFNRSLSTDEVKLLFQNKTNTTSFRELQQGETWACEITPNDAHGDGQNKTSTAVTISANTIPTVTVAFNSSTKDNTSAQDLMVYPTIIDADQTRTTTIANYLVNNSEMMLLNMPFEAKSNTTNTTDYSHFHNHGVVSGPSWYAQGGINGSGMYSLHGGTDTIVINDQDYLDFGTNKSFMFWYKPISTTANQHVMGKGKGAGTYEGCIMRMSSTLAFQCYNSAGIEDVSITTNTVPLNEWNLVSIVFYNNNVTFYLNGNYNSSDLSYQATYNSDSPLKIGQAQTGWSGSATDGFVDNVQIWNRSLTPEQLKTMYQTQRNLVINSSELKIHDVWKVNVTVSDSVDNSVGVMSSPITILNEPVGNSPPSAPLLVAPSNLTTTIVRTPQFNWTTSNDSDGNQLTYNLVIDDNILFNNLEINVTGIGNLTSGNVTYNISTELDVDKTYFWRVRANDGTDFGPYSNVSNFTLSSYLAITLTQDTINFGSVSLFTRANTTSGTPRPFRAENVGNIIANVTISATSYFSSVPFPSSYYQFKIRENETGAFNLTHSNTSFINMVNSTILPHVWGLDWHDFKNDFLADILVQLPDTEPIGPKNSTVTFSISQQ
ncbi:hypothetical protein HYV86_03760 [Candidatus Woesearchaeota archaeon]|nr:hypothetical protein [Candidatus Woesearchaeota archaeon]